MTPREAMLISMALRGLAQYISIHQDYTTSPKHKILTTNVRKHVIAVEVYVGIQKTQW